MRLISRCSRDAALSGKQARRVPRKFVDIHCHCLSGVDDGPQSMEQALMLCRSLVQDGIGAVVATPHQLGRFEGRVGSEAVREATRQMNRKLAEEGIDLKMLPGAEVRLDERMISLLLRDAILTLADGRRYVLLELLDDVFIDVQPLIARLAAQEMSLIIAHPERNEPLRGHSRFLERWLDHGAALQVTAASLLGEWGPRIEQFAWNLLTQGGGTVVASDAHDCDGRAPRMTEAFRKVSDRLGDEEANVLFIENPLRVLQGKTLLPVLAGNRQEVG